MLYSTQLIYEKVMIGVSKDTQVLTPQGWINVMKLTNKYKIATYRVEDQSIRFEHPSKVEQSVYTGLMYQFRPNTAPFIVTGDTVILKLFRPHDEMEENEKLKNKQKIKNVAHRIRADQDMKGTGRKSICVGKIYNHSGKNKLNTLERLAIAIYFRGEIEGDKVRFCFRGLNRKRELDKLLDLFNIEMLPIENNKYVKGYHVYEFMIPKVMDMTLIVKYFKLSEFTVERAKDFLQVFELWSSRVRTNRSNSRSYLMKNSRFCDNIQAICMLCGLRCSARILDNDVLELSLCYQSHCKTVYKPNGIKYNDDICYISVADRYIFVRRNKKIIVFGS